MASPASIVNLENPTYATFRQRVMASFVDSVLLLFILLPLLTAIHPLIYNDMQLSPEMMNQLHQETSMQTLGMLVQERDLQKSWLLDNLVQLAVVGIILIPSWHLFSYTPGKYLFRLRIVDATTGIKPTWLQSVIRYLSYMISGAPLFAGFIWIHFDKKHQGWHDKLARTVVIKLPKPAKTNK